MLNCWCKLNGQSKWSHTANSIKPLTSEGMKLISWTRKTAKKREEAASKMMDKFKDIMKEEETYLKCNDLKKRKKGGENYAIMEILKKKMELEERKLAVKQTCEDQIFLYVKAGNLDPDVVKFVHESSGGIYAHYAQKGGGKKAEKIMQSWKY